MPTIYPFTAIVGQERMRRALVLNAIDPRIGGVLIRGERGTAKSTAARALAALLPKVRAVKDCRFGCDPDQPASWCTECRERAASGEPLPVQEKPIPFVNLPVSATEDRVVGTLDIEKAIQKGERHFEAGRAGGSQPRPALHRRSQPAGRPRGGRAAGLGCHGHEHRRAGRHLLHPPGPLHPGRDDEPRRRRPAPAVAGPFRPVGPDHRHP